MASYPKAFTVPPAQPATKKAGQLTDQQLHDFFDQGCVIVPGFFEESDLNPCLEGLKEYVEGVVNQLYDEGCINDRCAALGLWERLVQIRKLCPEVLIRMSKYGKFPKNLDHLWGHAKLLNVMEQLVGPNVGGHPTWNIRFNTPDPAGDGAVAYVPWHQDSAYFAEDSRDHLIVTAWIPFQDTGGDNGGLMVLPRSHRRGVIATHEASFGTSHLLYCRQAVFEEQLGVRAQDAVTCHVPRGGLLLFSNALMHCSVPNNSDKVRWSADLRYQSTDFQWGYYDITDGIQFRRNGEDVKPDYDRMFAVNRPAIWQKRYFKEQEGTREDLKDVITGPWLANWAHTTPNKHTRAFQKYRK